MGELPSGYVKIAIENGTFIHLPIKDRDFPGRYVSLPEGNPLPDLKRKPPSMELSIWGKATSRGARGAMGQLAVVRRLIPSGLLQR